MSVLTRRGCPGLAALLLVAVVGGCSDDAVGRERTGIDAALGSFDCVEERNFGPGGWGWTATYECQVAGEPVRLHEHEGDHSRALELLAARYDSAHFFPCDRSAPFPSGYRVIDGDEWIAVAASPDAARALAEELGGTIQPVDPAVGGGPPVSYPELGPDCPR